MKLSVPHARVYGRVRAASLWTACLTAIAGLAAGAEAPAVRVTAQADGVGSIAQEQAVRAAQTEAVTQLLRVLAPSEEAELPPALAPILRNAPRYAQSTQVLRFDEQGDRTQVEADVRLDEQPLRHDVAALMLPRLREKPKVLLVVGEQVGGDEVPAVLPKSATECALIEGLKQFRLDPNSIEAAGDRFPQKQLLAAVTGSAQEGTVFASHLDLDAVVIGTAIATLDPSGTEQAPRIKATVRLRIHRGWDGGMVGQASGSAVVTSPYLRGGGEQAVQDATTRAIQQTAVECVLATLSRRAQHRMLLTILNPGEAGRVAPLLDILQRLEGVNNAEILFLEEDRCRIRADYAGPMSHIGDVLWDAPGGAPLKIKSIIGREAVAAFE